MNVIEFWSFVMKKNIKLRIKNEYKNEFRMRILVKRYHKFLKANKCNNLKFEKNTVVFMIK
jgi:hypothetical protein